MYRFFIFFLIIFSMSYSEKIKISLFAFNDITKLSKEETGIENKITVFYGDPFAKGEQGIDDLNHLKIDFVSLRKSIFSQQIFLVKKLMQKANFRFLCSNLLSIDESIFKENDRQMIFDFKGIKVGVFSLINYEANKQKDQLVISDIFTSEKEVKKLKEKGCDIIIAFICEEQSSKLLQQLEDIDIMICLDAKDTISFYEKKTLIYNFGEKKDFCNRIDFMVEKKATLKGFEVELYPSW